MNNHVYRVVAYRHGATNPSPWGQPYDVLYTLNEGAAIRAATAEYHDRGCGKYEVGVWRIECDNADAVPALIHYEGHPRKAPEEHVGFRFFLSVGYEFGQKMLDGEMPIPKSDTPDAISMIECAGLTACMRAGRSIGKPFDEMWERVRAQLEAKP